MKNVYQLLLLEVNTQISLVNVFTNLIPGMNAILMDIYPVMNTKEKVNICAVYIMEGHTVNVL